MKTRLIFLLTSLIFFSQTLALAGDDPYDQAKDLAKTGQWAQARDLAEQGTQKEPTDAKRWYLLGVVEQRLEHEKAAADAFQKVLEIEPHGPLARAVSVTLPDQKAKGDNEQKYKWGPDSPGFFFSFSPAAGIAAASQMGSSLSTSIEGGFQFQKIQIGFRYGSGTVGKIFAPAEGSDNGATNQPATNYLPNSSGGSHTFKELYMNVLLPVLDPYTSLGGLQLNIPLFLGGFENSVSLAQGLTANNSGSTFGNIGWDFATGLQATYYTKSFVAVDLAAMYHWGFPFWNIREDGNTAGIEGPSNQQVTGGTTGFEVSLGVTFLFGASQPDQF
jgi:hypothetical protein